MSQVLKYDKFLLQSASGITDSDNYYKVRQNRGANNSCWIVMIWFASVTNRFGFNYEVVKTMSSFAHCAHISIENNTPHPWPGS